MADEKFRLPGSSYDQLVRIIKAYGSRSEPSSPGDVADVLGVDQTIVSRNNGFLLSAGIVEGGNRKQLTDSGRTLSHALDYEMEEEIRNAWSGVVQGTEFLTKLVTAVRIRGGMEPSSFQSHVAYTAGQPNKGTVKTGAATVVQILSIAGWLEDRDDKLIAADRQGAVDEPTAASPVASDPSPDRSSREVPVAPASVPRDRGASPELSVQIRVSVDCTVSELPELAESLRGLLDLVDGDVAIESGNGS